MIVIHIGLRKAGSTSIQSFLSHNEKGLLDLGVDYPRVGRPRRSNNHLNIAAEVRGRRNFVPGHGALAELAAHRDANGGPTLVLSAEAFEECEAAEAARLKQALAAPNEPVRIVLVLRDLVDLIPSSYAQMVKVGSKSHDFDAFFAKRIGERRMDYRDIARRWTEAFGWQSLHLRLLDRSVLVNGDLIDDFCTLIGVDPDVAAARLKRPGEANVNPGWRVVEAMRALVSGRADLAPSHPLRGVERMDGEARRRIGLAAMAVGEARGWNAERGRYLTRAQAQWCLELYAEAVEALNARLGERPGPALPVPRSLEERGFVEREALPEAGLIPAADLADFYDELGARAARALESRAA